MFAKLIVIFIVLSSVAAIKNKAVTPRMKVSWASKNYRKECTHSSECLDTDLICSKDYLKSNYITIGQCVCAKNQTYVRGVNKCFEAVSPPGAKCTFDEQCQAGKWGAYSKCNDETHQCECWDRYGDNRTYILHEEVCTPPAICQDDDDCKAKSFTCQRHNRTAQFGECALTRKGESVKPTNL